MYSVDTTNTDQLDVWLVKVPKYIANNWKNAPAKTELGKLKRCQDGSYEFNLNERIDKNNPETSEKLPSQYKLSLNPITHQKMVILSQTKDPSGPTTNTSAQNGASASGGSGNNQSTANDKISFKGDVNFRGELRTKGDTFYMNLKSSSIRAAAKPAMTTKVLEKHVNTYKPRGATQLAHEAELRKKKDEARKTIREDKEVVLERLYRAFEKQQYYNIKDLVRITNQPLPPLKEILKEICVYCSSGTHKNMWELKPEYRHYKS
uniref:General transcription factor IIF subunit 2 n=1 Tax=Aceria tosichella TaxID=561515 RepID=A0A6G1S763_9ACAR